MKWMERNALKHFARNGTRILFSTTFFSYFLHCFRCHHTQLVTFQFWSVFGACTMPSYSELIPRTHSFPWTNGWTVVSVCVRICIKFIFYFFIFWCWCVGVHKQTVEKRKKMFWFERITTKAHDITFYYTSLWLDTKYTREYSAQNHKWMTVKWMNISSRHKKNEKETEKLLEKLSTILSRWWNRTNQTRDGVRPN